MQVLGDPHPDWKKRVLAEEVSKRAGEEFDKSELPSAATIERHMVDILGGGSGEGAGQPGHLFSATAVGVGMPVSGASRMWCRSTCTGGHSCSKYPIASHIEERLPAAGKDGG